MIALTRNDKLIIGDITFEVANITSGRAYVRIDGADGQEVVIRTRSGDEKKIRLTTTSSRD